MGRDERVRSNLGTGVQFLKVVMHPAMASTLFSQLLIAVTDFQPKATLSDQSGQEMQTICISLMSEKWVWGHVALVLQTDSTIVQETCLS